MASPDAHADLILTNGRITISAASGDEAEALAARGGRVVAVGPAADVLRLRGPETKVVDLAGRRAIPALIDAHVHPLTGTAVSLFSAAFPTSSTPAEIEAALGKFFDANPHVEYVMGGRIGSDFLSRYAGELVPTPREWLDARSRGRAVYIREESGHNGWANSRALEHLGIDDNFVDPKGGKVVRDAAGKPTGLLVEEVDMNARTRWPDWSQEQYRAALAELCKRAAAYGLCGLKDANVAEPLLKAYSDADRAGALTLRIAACLATPFGHRETPLDYAELERLRDAYKTERIDTRHVKLYLDGVPLCESRSACMIDPYLPDPGFPPGHHGSLHISGATLANDVTQLDARGFTVKLHAAGDGAIRAALDAIEAARKANGTDRLGHELAHAGFVHPEDLPRFKQLNAVADLSPYLFKPSPIMADIRRCVGDHRTDGYFPIKDFLSSETPVLAGSDWPAAAVSMNPWIGIAGMVTRADAAGNRHNPGQAIPVGRALEVFTARNARALGLEGEAGTLEVGRWCNVAVLDRDVYAVEEAEIGGTEAVMTVFEGRVVHERA
ncbi:amidohydrolase 3 [Hyaloraphidium curvatum]|nr:amidohydrolase 3 [Hyaloraphidium curvatum]